MSEGLGCMTTDQGEAYGGPEERNIKGSNISTRHAFLRKQRFRKGFCLEICRGLFVVGVVDVVVAVVVVAAVVGGGSAGGGCGGCCWWVCRCWRKHCRCPCRCR